MSGFVFLIVTDFADRSSAGNAMAEQASARLTAGMAVQRSIILGSEQSLFHAHGGQVISPLPVHTGAGQTSEESPGKAQSGRFWSYSLLFLENNANRRADMAQARSHDAPCHLGSSVRRVRGMI